MAQSGPGVQCWFHDERVPERLRAAILAEYGRFARLWLKMGLIRDDLGHLGHLGHRSTHVQEFRLCPTGPEVTYLSLKLSKKGGPRGENGLFGAAE